MTHSDPITVEFEFTPEDWERANATHSWNSELTKNALKQMQVLFGAIVSLMALLLFLGGTGLGAAAMLIAGTLMFGMLRPLVRHSQKRQIKKVADLGLINGIFGPHRVELRDDGILNSTTGYEWLVRWSAIEDIKESDGSFLIYSGANSFLTIPSSAFPDNETLRAFGDRFFERLSQVEKTLLPGRDTPED
jgi:hypothetical protein